jgi:hypothetical protein
MRNIIICCDGTGNEISENISNVLKLYRCLRKTEKTQPQKQRGWPMVERRDLFRICQILPISHAEKNRRPAGGDARTAVRHVLSFIRQVVEPSICGTVPSARSSRRPRTPRSPRSHAQRSHGNRGSHGNHRSLGGQQRRRAAACRCDQFPYRRDGTWRG